MMMQYFLFVVVFFLCEKKMLIKILKIQNVILARLPCTRYVENLVPEELQTFFTRLCLQSTRHKEYPTDLSSSSIMLHHDAPSV